MVTRIEEPVTDGRGGLVIKPPPKRWQVGRDGSRGDAEKSREEVNEESKDEEYEDVKEAENDIKDTEEDNNSESSEEAKDRKSVEKIDKRRLLNSFVQFLNRNLR